jgi:hypothetical protein
LTAKHCRARKHSNQVHDLTSSLASYTSGVIQELVWRSGRSDLLQFTHAYLLDAVDEWTVAGLSFRINNLRQRDTMYTGRG